MASPILTAAQARELFIYDPDTGEFVTRVRSGNRPAGAQVGSLRARCKRGNGYVVINYRDRHYYAHRLAWLYMTGEWPKGQVDHINAVRNDNRFCNLRDVTQTANNLNPNSRRQKNVVGVLGVSKITRSEKVEARFTFDGQVIRVGYFEDPDEAGREVDRVKAFMCSSPHAQALKSLVSQKDLTPNGLRCVIDLLG